jgi:hypothetical protein
LSPKGYVRVRERVVGMAWWGDGGKREGGVSVVFAVRNQHPTSATFLNSNKKAYARQQPKVPVVATMDVFTCRLQVCV